MKVGNVPSEGSPYCEDHNSNWKTDFRGEEQQGDGEAKKEGLQTGGEDSRAVVQQLDISLFWTSHCKRVLTSGTPLSVVVFNIHYQISLDWPTFSFPVL